MRKNLSIRYISTELGQALDAERERSEKSLNETVLSLLERALGVDDGAYDNGLGNLAGEWSERDLATFENAASQKPRPRNDTPTKSDRPASDQSQWSPS